MASTTTTNASDASAPSSAATDKPASSPQRACAGMHSDAVLFDDAVEGLTSLVAPRSPSNSSLSPSESSEVGAKTKNASYEANENDVSRSTRTSQTSYIGKSHVDDKSKIIKRLAVKEPMVKLAMTPSTSVPTFMSHHSPLVWSPAVHKMMPHPARESRVPIASRRPSGFKKPTQIGKPPEGFRNIHVGFTNFSEYADMATHRFPAPVVGRFSAMSGAAATSLSFLAPARPSFPYYGYHYQDHNPTPLPPPATLLPPLSIPRNKKNFPETLLEVISSEVYSDIISWLPHGRGFVLLDKERFTSMVLPHYFDGAKFTSFTRRLKRWGFSRVPRGPELGAYYNKNFVRDQPGLVQEMRYQMDGQLEEGKRKIKEDGTAKEQNENIERRKVQKSSSNKVQAQLHDKSSTSTLKNLGENKKQQPLALPANISSPKKDSWHFTRPQDPLLQRCKASAVQKKHYVGSHSKNEKEAAAFRKNMKHLVHLTNGTEPSLLPRECPNFATSNDHYRPREMEIHREFVFSQSIQSNEVAGRGPRSGLASTPGVLAMASGSVSNGSRPVLMSLEEEEDFARYLFLKRKKCKGVSGELG